MRTSAGNTAGTRQFHHDWSHLAGLMVFGLSRADAALAAQRSARHAWVCSQPDQQLAQAIPEPQQRPAVTSQAANSNSACLPPGPQNW
jgi:hypothetical protein